MKEITLNQSKIFIQLQQGLYGDFAYKGLEGVMAVVENAGCIQFDPVDVCGINSQLVFYARVKNFKKEDATALLYDHRHLVDHMDKIMAIYPTKDWPCYSRNRQKTSSNLRSQTEVEPYLGKVYQHIEKHGPVTLKELPAYHTKVYWYGGEKEAEKAAVETLYHQGKVLVHHKVGNQKIYDVAPRLLGKALYEAPDPFKTQQEYYAWRMKRRIGAVGIMWEKASDAWLNIEGLKVAKRKEMFTWLIDKKEITPVKIQGIPETFYYLTAKEEVLQQALAQEKTEKKRIVFLPPLDQMMWDRKIIKALYGFDYTWEQYAPANKRVYGHYTMPVLYGIDFIGRIQMQVKGKQLIVDNFWPEKPLNKNEEKALDKALEDFKNFHQCSDFIWEKA